MLIKHEGIVNRARYMPQKASMIATKKETAEIHLFDILNPPSKNPPSAPFKPYLRLRGHKDGGHGLSWSPLKQGHLLSGSRDAQICLWDVAAPTNALSLQAHRTFKEGLVEGVDWHSKYEHLFGSVGEKYLKIWDLRVESSQANVISLSAHEDNATCLDFNPLNEWALATGSADKTVRYFDVRMMSRFLHTLNSHRKEVLQIEWHPAIEYILASSCGGRRLMVWDFSRVDDKQDQEDAIEGPPELLFIHGGHTCVIPDFSWSLDEDWTIASVAEDSILQIWQMVEHIYDD